MRFMLAIECDDDAFQPNPRAEVARLLRETAERLEHGVDFSAHGMLVDQNGNRVGEAGFVTEG